MQPANLPGHKYAAGPTALTGPSMPGWRAAPFAAAAAPGTKNRSRERVQAHLDRIQIMKAHHAQAQQRLKAQQQRAKNYQQTALNLRRDIQTARAMSIGALKEQNREKWRRQLNQKKVALAGHREMQADVNRTAKQQVRELKKLEKEIDKLTGKLVKNRTAAKTRPAAKKTKKPVARK